MKSDKSYILWTSKFRIKNWVERNDDFLGTQNTNTQIRFKSSMLKSSLYDYSDTYILVKMAISVAAASGTDASNDDEKVVFKSCAAFAGCISKINNTKVDNPHDIDVVMSMHNLIEYRDNYSRKSAPLWRYSRGEAITYDVGDITNFVDGYDSNSFKFKQKITGQTGDDGRENVKMMTPMNI